MSVFWLGLVLAAALSLVMALAWAIALRSARSGWIDAVWSFAIGAAGLGAALLPLESSAAISGRQWLVAGLVAIWSLRLGFHISARTLQQGDDPRYTYLHQQWGDDAPRKLFLFLQIQAAAALLLALSIGVAARNPAPQWQLGDWLGVLIALAAVIGEGIADAQLARFRADPNQRGGVCDKGLWAFSRHPNYFFECVGWLAYAAIALDLTGAYPWGFLALTGPAFMYWLLVHVSGVPPLEAHMLRSRGAAFRVYQARVNRFWPGPAKKTQSGAETGKVQ